MSEIRAWAKKIYNKELFRPGCLGIFINPYYIARSGLFKHIKKFGYYIQGKTLDVGCGTSPYKDLFLSTEYIGMDLDTEETRIRGLAEIYYNGNGFPLESSSFDSVVINQVLEHVFNPDQFLSEIFRVLKSSGTVLVTVPFVWDEHEKPFDYARYSSFGLKSLFEKSGFKVVEQCKSIADVRVFFQIIINYFVGKTVTRFVWLNILITICFFSPITISGMIWNIFLPANPDFYLDNIMVLKKI